MCKILENNFEQEHKLFLKKLTTFRGPESILALNIPLEILISQFSRLKLLFSQN